MSKSADAELFPLPLAAFEQYMLTDDCPEYPATFFLRFTFDARFERPALEAALVSALLRHPLLNAFTVPVGNERFQWEPAGTVQPPLSWHDGRFPAAGPAELRIDLSRQIGFHIFMVELDGRTQMWLQIHHTSCDGLGAMRFVEDLLAAYHDAVAPHCPRPPSRPVDLSRLRHRGRFGLNPLSNLLRVPKEALGLLGSTEFFAHRVAPLAASSPLPDAGLKAYPSVCAHTFSAEATAKLRQAVEKIGGTVNDLLIRQLFAAVVDWNSNRDPQSASRFLRIMIPTNLRMAADDSMPAANVVSMVFLDRRPAGAISNKMAKLSRLEMKLCKKWRLGLTMIRYMQAYRAFPGGLRRLLPKDRCLATTVLSNFGDATRRMSLPRRDGRIVAGNAMLEDIAIVPPIRPLTHATFCANFYAGRLNASVQFDPAKLSSEDGQELLRQFTDRVEAATSE
jgi:hypothetical protein